VKIIDCLKISGSSLSYGNKWLVITENNMFRVYEHTYRAKESVCLIETDNEDEAAKELMR
jgi:hypothetical protein